MNALSKSPFNLLLLAMLLLALPLLLVTLPTGAAAQNYPHLADTANPMKAPGAYSGPRLPLGMDTRTGYHHFLDQPVHSPTQPLMLGLMGFYRTVISPVNGDQSDLAPVHSLYAVQAVKDHGVLLGALLITERLIHEPDELAITVPFREKGRTFHYDPLLHNTYWLWDWLK